MPVVTPFGGVDRFREGSSQASGIDRRHGAQLQPRTNLRVERQADQAAAVRGHEIDGFWRDLVGGDGQVAFVLAVFVVNDNKDLALAKIFDRLGNGSKRHSGIAVRRSQRRRTWPAKAWRI